MSITKKTSGTKAPSKQNVRRKRSQPKGKHVLHAYATAEAEWDTDAPPVRVSSAFAAILVLHVIAVGVFLAHEYFRDQPTPMVSSTVEVPEELNAVAVSTKKEVKKEQRVEKKLVKVPVVAAPGHTFLPGGHQQVSAPVVVPQETQLQAPKPLASVEALPAPVASSKQASKETAAAPKKAKVVAAKPVLKAIPLPDLSHTVAKGDTLFGIAQEYRVPLDQLKAYNGIEDVNSIILGAELVIPQLP